MRTFRTSTIMWIEGFLCLISVLTSSAMEMLPVFLAEPESTVISHHASVTLPCQVEPESADVRWRLNGELVTENNNRGISFNGTNLYISKFKHRPKRLSNDGIYQCIAETSFGSVTSRPASLSRAVLKRFQRRDNLDLNVTEGHNILLPCQPPVSSPAANIYFIHNGSLLLSGTTDHHSVLSTGSLLIYNATQRDRGQYRCSAINPLTNQNRTADHVINLHVFKPSQAPSQNVTIVTSTTTFQARVGENVTLECVAMGNPQPIVTWERYGGNMPENRSSVHHGNFFIWEVRHEDAGTYICKAGSSQVKVIVLELIESPRVTAEVQYVTVTPGESVRLRCRVSDPPIMEVIWYHNAEPITNILTVESGKAHSIRNVRPKDAGFYQCMYSNDVYGISYAIIKVEVKSEAPSGGNNGTETGSIENGVPDRKKGERNSYADCLRRRRKKKGKKKIRCRKPRCKNKPCISRPHNDQSTVKLVPPTEPTVSQLSDTSVKLEWTVPQNDGLDITFFRVQYKQTRPKKSQWKTEDNEIPANKFMYEVSNLKPEATYKFRIVAVYSNDDNRPGPNSQRFKLEVKRYHQPKAPEGKPIILEVKPVEFKEDNVKLYGLNVKWKYNPIKKSKIEGFFLHYKPFHSPPDDFEYIQMTEPRTRAYFLEGLKPSTSYSIKIQSFNSAGRSAFSTEVVMSTNGERILPHDINKIGNPVSSVTDSPVVDNGDDPKPEGPSSAGKKLTTQPTSEILYMILGIVLGVMMLLLIVFMFMCWWRQRQQRRMMDAMNNAVRGKFQDSSQRIYADSLRKKYAGMNGMNGSIANGSVANGHLPNMYTKMNINVNPMSEMDNQVLTNGHSGHRSPHHYQHGSFVPNGSIPSHHSGSDNNFNKMTQSLEGSLHRGLDPCLQISGHQDCTQSPDSFGGGEAPACPPSPRSSSNVPSCFERFNTDSPSRYSNSNRSCDQLESSHDHLQETDSKNTYDGSINSISGANGENTGNKNRRRRKRTAQLPKEQSTRDQATNTDLSSNEGTIEFSTFGNRSDSSGGTGQREGSSTSPVETFYSADHGNHDHYVDHSGSV